MSAGKRAATEPVRLWEARFSLALMGAAAAGFLASAVLGADASAKRDDALERAGIYYREHPYLDAPLEVLLATGADEAPGFDASALDAEALQSEQRELDAIVAELDAAARATPAHRIGLTPGGASALGFALHAFVHVSWLHLLWNLGLLATAGARLERLLGRARFAGLLFGAAAAGAGAHLAASAPEAAPFVGLSAATAGLIGAFAVRPGDVVRDPLAPEGARATRSPIRAAALLGAGVCAIAALFGANAPSFAPAAQLGGFAVGAGLMLAFLRAGALRDPAHAPLSPEIEQALARLHAGDPPAALELLRARLASGVDDALAARAMGRALRGRADAPEALAQALQSAIDAQQREAACALWRELAAIGAPAGADSAGLRTLASWLRAAGALGEARAAAIASLEGADAETVLRLAKEARRADPVFALRAAERALAMPGLNALEHKALLGLLEQARKDARNAGVIVLDAAREAEAAAQRGAAEPRSRPASQREIAPPRDDADLASLAGDVGALELEALSDDPVPEPPEQTRAGHGAEPEAHDAQRALFERDAIDLAPPEAEAPELPDPAVAGDDALLDALHEALSGDGVDLGAPLAEDAPQLAAPADLPPASQPREAALAQTVVRLGDAEAGRPTGPRAVAPLSVPALPASADDFAFGQAADSLFAEDLPKPAPPRPLRVSAATPERLGSSALVLEVEGRGRAKLAYAKIDAVAAAGVRGLSPSGKAVLLIDLAIGFAADEGELRVVRLRADAFDPRTLVAGHTSPLSALRALVAELRARTRGVPLPRESDPSAPFRIYADLATYEREAFGAERK